MIARKRRYYVASNKVQKKFQNIFRANANFVAQKIFWMSYKVNSTPFFEREAKPLIKKYPSLSKELLQLIDSLSDYPEQGTALSNHCYKIRLSIKSKRKGKSGGAR